MKNAGAKEPATAAFAVLSRLGIAAACLALGFGAGALKWRGSAQSFHREARMAAILAQAQQMQPGGVLVIGDSITERERFDTLCDRPALNAGISWSTSRDWIPDVRKIIAAAHPSIVVLEIGTNDKGRFTKERQQLERLATFTVAPPKSTVDGVHPDALGSSQFIAEIERGCHHTSPSASS